MNRFDTPSPLRPLAHELRNAIAPVRNAAHLLRKRAASDPIVAAALQTIDAAVGASLRLLDRAVDAERVMQGDVTLASDDLALSDVVQQAIDATASAVAEKRQRVHVQGADSGARVRGDGARLAQIVGTLVDNASRYSDDEAQIEIAIERSGSNARIRVRDHGSGIPTAFLPRLFEPLATREPSEGRGASPAMSLPVARRLAELHGGRLEATSDGEACGSEFVVTLPSPEAGAGDARATADVAAAAKTASSGPRRVLLVDDNRAVRETYADVLSDLGCDVDTAADGEQALARALQWRPRFVLLDINLPKRNGYEVARTLRAQFAPTEMTLVMISGTLLDESTRASARAAGFDHCLDKASDLPTLEQVLGIASQG